MDLYIYIEVSNKYVTLKYYSKNLNITILSLQIVF